MGQIRGHWDFTRASLHDGVRESSGSMAVPVVYFCGGVSLLLTFFFEFLSGRLFKFLETSDEVYRMNFTRLLWL